MNLFTSEKASAVLAIFLAVVGFYVTSVVEEIRSQPVVTYRFDRAPDGSAELRLENISLASLVEDSRFEIACVDLRPDCLRPQDGDADRFHKLTREPPVSPSNTSVDSTASGVALSATLVPGAVVRLTTQRSDAALEDDTTLEFYYTAAPNDPKSLLLIDGYTATAVFVGSYFHIMILAFGVALFGLVVVIVVPLFKSA
ncbi:hypothetical protein [Pseudoponticoccus marisrubri]|uniref:Uncharacterized protein n=1 Tax=Pseudoponticoccus marisrubri TaxID=1685382 RepID=A0A0W7WLK9_9RHOB|nr:hypothetical protein [Pseudoponticoccus marisrubri]KUF11434.1 hypothetical protein AVJ23_06620 [Pseudoponticoccus marisrubri]